MRSSSQCVVPLLRLVRRHEVLHLHLLELARAEDEVAGRDLVAERLADLRDPERRLLARELQDVLEVEEDPLGGLGAQEDARALVRDRAHVRLEHQVEHARLGQLAAALGAAQLALRLGLAQVVLAPAPLALAEALDERVGEPLEVARGLPRRGWSRIAESSATMSSRSWSIARHHSFFTLFFSSTP